jgi:polycystin 1L2
MGNLNYLKIWHDNSGKGDKASWFLKYIIVRDMQTKEKFYFLCNNWLAVEHGDAKLERGLFIALDKQKTELKYLLGKQAKTYLTDNHLWLSVFTKPVQSTFTRLDRVTCCFVFHYLAMVLNILYYKISLGILPSSIQINLNYVNFTIEQVNFKLKNFNINPINNTLTFFSYTIQLDLTWSVC